MRLGWHSLNSDNEMATELCTFALRDVRGF